MRGRQRREEGEGEKGRQGGRKGGQIDLGKIFKN